MRKVSPATVSKKINALKEEINELVEKENKTCTYIVSPGEKPEETRPDYDYKETQRRIIELEEEVRKLRHIMNLFNTSTVVPGYDMTIDEILVYIPHLRERKNKLSVLKNRLPKSRNCSYQGIVEYTYCNYSVDKAAADYKVVSEELSKAQNALDYINSTGEIEVDW